jgi:Concanavalin A-like lectin/glucanases superfamily/Bacterial TSP3 repeat
MKSICELTLILLITSLQAMAANNGLVFDGVDDWVDVPGGIIATQNTFTVECWALSLGNTGSHREIMSQGSSGNAFYMGTDPAGNIRLGDTWGAPGVAFPFGDRHHFAVVVTTNDTLFYIDGTLEANKGSAIAVPANPTSFRLGRQFGVHGEYWPGVIDEVRIWDGARTAEEIQDNMMVLGPDTNSLRGHYTFNETEGTNLSDHAGAVGDGTLMGGMGDDSWSGLPTLDITTSNATVGGLTAACTIGGTNNDRIVGTMAWANPATGGSGTFPAISPWTVIDIPLATGANIITVTGTNSLGVSASDSVTITLDALHTGDSPTHYVATNGTSIWPYTNWTTAATQLQDAVDAANSNDTVLVTNGTYTSSTEITVSKAITVESVNGREVTRVDGQNTHRCFNLGNVACTIDGFTIQNGMVVASDGAGVHCTGTTPLIKHCTISGNTATLLGGAAYDNGRGGGAYYGTLTDCTIVSNVAGWHGGGAYKGVLTHCTLSDNEGGWYGGGAYGGVLTHCTITGNSTEQGGGGCSGSTLYNCLIADNITWGSGGGTDGCMLNHCTIASNEAWNGGGCYWSTLNNCIVWNNTSGMGGNGNDWEYGTIANSCSPGLSGNGNITNNPLFVDAAATNLYLQLSSPCIDTGTNLGYTNDLDGTARPLDGDANGSALPDMGAYEAVNAAADTDTDGLNDWAEVYTHFSSPLLTDSDGDGLVDGVEVHTYGSNPTNSDSDSDGLNDGVEVNTYGSSPTNSDSDGDGLDDWVEVNTHGTSPILADTDGDGPTDPEEIAWGVTSPTNDNSDVMLFGQWIVTNNPASFGLYTADSIQDLDMGQLMVQISNGMMQLNLQLKQTEDLVSGPWTNAGSPVEWQVPADTNKAFIRVQSGTP